jgi:DNA invertase Pin-like site-specific DNA recombinase
MSKLYGYCRVSRKEQNIERQIRNIIKEYPDAIIVQEAYTGTKIDGRKEFQKLLKLVGAGDTIVFDSVSRMSRNADDGVSLYFDLYDKNVNLIFLKETYINTEVFKSASSQSIPMTGNDIADIYIKATNKVIKILATEQIKKAFEQSQKEVDDMRQRTKEGMVTARLAGKQIGRKTGSVVVTKKEKTAKEFIRKRHKDFGGTLNNKETWTLAGISKMTFYKYKAELLEELQES